MTFFYIFILPMDIFKRTLSTVLSMFVLWYTSYIFWANGTITNISNSSANIAIFVVMIVLLLLFAIFFGIAPKVMKYPKITLLVCWLAFILLGKLYLVNDFQSSNYLGDIVIVFGILVVFLGATGFLITSKVIQEEKQSNMEIIEV